MKKALIIMTLLFSVAGSLQAASITNTATVAMVSETDATVSLAKFDTQDGTRTLTGIHIEFSTAINGATFEFDNDSVTARNRLVTLSFDALLFSTSVRLTGTGINVDGSGLSISDSTTLSVSGTKGDSTTQFNATGLLDYALWTLTAQTATAGGYVDSSVFADYIGSGDFTATLNSGIYFGYSTVSLLRSRELIPAEFSATVVYDYAVIPEPAAIGLIGLGGIITLTVSRLRRRK